MRGLPLLCLVAGCGGESRPPDVDAEPPARSCRELGPITLAGKVGRAGGVALSNSGIESDPHVMRDGGLLKMWFTTANATPPHDLRSAYAESDDGLTWRLVDDAAIQPTAGTFDGNGVETVSVARDGDKLVAYYTGDEPPDGSIRFAIGRAVSTDGIAWEKHATPVIAPALAWEQPFCEDDACTKRIGGPLEPSVIFDGSTYRMWYAALGALGEVPSFRVGYATSADGITWERRADPVFTAGPAGTWDEVLVSHTNVVADPGGGYHLFYFGSSFADHARCDAAGGCLLTPGSIGHAFSEDGVSWTRDPANPMITPQGFGAWSVGGPSALIEDGVLKLWYFGTPASHSLDLRLGFASAPCT